MFVSNGMKNARFLLPTKRNESLLYFSAAARGQRVFQRRDDRCAPIESAEIPRRSNNGANCFGVEPCLPDRVCRAVQSSRVRDSAVEIGKNLGYCTERPGYSDMDRSYSHLPAIPPEPDDEHLCSPCFRRGTPVVTGLPAFFLRFCVTVERTIKHRDCDTRRPSESRHATSTQLCGSSLSKPVAARLSQRIPLSRRREQARTAWQSRSR